MLLLSAQRGRLWEHRGQHEPAKADISVPLRWASGFTDRDAACPGPAMQSP